MLIGATVRNKHNGKIGTIIAVQDGCNALYQVRYRGAEFAVWCVPDDLELV